MQCPALLAFADIYISYLSPCHRTRHLRRPFRKPWVSSIATLHLLAGPTGKEKEKKFTLSRQRLVSVCHTDSDARLTHCVRPRPVSLSVLYSCPPMHDNTRPKKRTQTRTSNSHVTV